MLKNPRLISPLRTHWMKHRLHLLLYVETIQNFLSLLSFAIAQTDEELSCLGHFKCLDSCNQSNQNPLSP